MYVAFFAGFLFDLYLPRLIWIPHKRRKVLRSVWIEKSPMICVREWNMRWNDAIRMDKINQKALITSSPCSSSSTMYRQIVALLMKYKQKKLNYIKGFVSCPEVFSCFRCSQQTNNAFSSRPSINLKQNSCEHLFKWTWKSTRLLCEKSERKSQSNSNYAFQVQTTC